MDPGDEREVTFAIVWSRGADHLDSVHQLKEDVRLLREAAPDILQPRIVHSTPAPQPYNVLGFAQNYPNPFGGRTTIRYSLPRAMQVRLAVYDVLGREVATLVEARQKQGIHEATFEAGDLPDGVYLYRIELDHLRFTRMMLLLR